MSSRHPLRVREVGEQLGLSDRSIYRLISSGRLPAAQPAGAYGEYRVQQEAVDQLWGEIKRRE